MKLPFLETIWPRGKKLVVWLAAAFVFYTVVGYLLLPPVARVIAMKELSKHLDRPVTIQKVGLNPYRFSASIRGLLIKDPDGEPLVEWERAEVNFQLVSLLSPHWVFKEVSLSQPRVRVRVNKDYTLNFSDIVKRLSAEFASKAAEPMNRRAWRINRLRLTGAKVFFTDLTPRIPFQRTIGPLEMTLLDFRTDSANKNQYVFSGITDGGERFSWKGFFYLDPLRSEGEFSLDGVSLVKYAPLYQDLVRFKIEDGVINLHSTYRYERSAANHLLAVRDTTFALQALKVVEKETGQTVVEASKLVVTGASVDAVARQAEAGTVTVSDGRLLLRRNQDNSVNAIELSKPAESAPHTPGGIVLLLRAMTNVVAMLLNSTNLSNGTIGELHLHNCALNLEDLVNSQPVRLDLDRIEIRGKNISNRAGTNMTADVSLRWDTNGTIQAGITAGLSPPSAEVKLRFDNLSLPLLAPYLEPHLNVMVLSGNLGLAGTVRYRGSREELPEVRFQGDAWLGGVSLAEGISTEGLLLWNSLQLSGIEANLNPPVVSVAKARLEDAFGRLIIETNRTLNLMSALRRGDTNAAAGLPLRNPAAVRAKVSLASMVVTNANLHFIDRSLQPNVNITLEKLNGTLSGLSSDDPQQAELHLQGAFDKTARAEVRGYISPWNSRQPLELTVTLNEMDLLAADPYSGKYLGYRLTKGKLSAQLSYQVSDRQLKSENHLTVHQLTLGQKVESPDATRLPVRLAIAILKDRNGTIALEVPVNGSLDDPEFNLGKVAYRAIETVLTRIATSPFRALGAFFGGKGEELSFLEFEPGSTNLLPATLEKLDLLANGLHERPELQLEIEGSVNPLTDLEALRRAELKKELLAKKGNAATILRPAETRVPATNKRSSRSSQKAFSSEKGASALLKPWAHWSLLETQSRTREDPLPISSFRPYVDDKGATALMLLFAPVAAAADPDRERELLEAVIIAPEVLPTLASERARNVRAYLLQTGKVEAQRITESARGASAKDSGVYLRLQ